MTNNPIRICIAGVTGKVGRLLAAAICEAADLALVAGTSKKAAGKVLSDVIPELPLQLLLSADVASALKTTCDVLIDYTHPEIVESNVLQAIEHGVHVVIGTSGLSDGQFAEIDKKAREAKVGVLAVGNFSLSGALMQHFAMIAARHMPTWEIADFGTDRKPDAPSGTARELAYRLGQIRKPYYEVPIEDTKGDAEARGATLNGSQVHSFRLPGVFSRCEVHFGLPQQRLTVQYESSGSQPYVDGTLLAARNVSSFVGLRRGLDGVLDL